MSVLRRRSVMGIASGTIAAATALIAPSAWAAPTITLNPPPTPSLLSISAGPTYTSGCQYDIAAAGLSVQPGSQVTFTDNGAVLGTAYTNSAGGADALWSPTTTGAHTLAVQASGQTLATTTASVGGGFLASLSGCAHF